MCVDYNQFFEVYLDLLMWISEIVDLIITELNISMEIVKNILPGLGRLQLILRFASGRCYLSRRSEKKVKNIKKVKNAIIPRDFIFEFLSRPLATTFMFGVQEQLISQKVRN